MTYTASSEVTVQPPYHITPPNAAQLQMSLQEMLEYDIKNRDLRREPAATRQERTS